MGTYDRCFVKELSKVGIAENALLAIQGLKVQFLTSQCCYISYLHNEAVSDGYRHHWLRVHQCLAGTLLICGVCGEALHDLLTRDLWPLKEG